MLLSLSELNLVLFTSFFCSLWLRRCDQGFPHIWFSLSLSLRRCSCSPETWQLFYLPEKNNVVVCAVDKHKDFIQICPTPNSFLSRHTATHGLCPHIPACDCQVCLYWCFVLFLLFVFNRASLCRSGLSRTAGVKPPSCLSFWLSWDRRFVSPCAPECCLSWKACYCHMPDMTWWLLTYWLALLGDQLLWSPTLTTTLLQEVTTIRKYITSHCFLCFCTQHLPPRPAVDNGGDLLDWPQEESWDLERAVKS